MITFHEINNLNSRGNTSHGDNRLLAQKISKLVSENMAYSNNGGAKSQ